MEKTDAYARKQAPLDPLTMLALSDGTFLEGRLTGSTVAISSVASEVTQGVRRSNGRAWYVGGNGTSALEFAYVVQPHDETALLEALALEASEGSLSLRAAAFPHALADLALPSAKVSARYSSAATVPNDRDTRFAILEFGV